MFIVILIAAGVAGFAWLEMRELDQLTKNALDNGKDAGTGGGTLPPDDPGEWLGDWSAATVKCAAGLASKDPTACADAVAFVLDHADEFGKAGKGLLQAPKQLGRAAVVLTGRGVEYVGDKVGDAVGWLNPFDDDEPVMTDLERAIRGIRPEGTSRAPDGIVSASTDAALDLAAEHLGIDRPGGTVVTAGKPPTQPTRATTTRNTSGERPAPVTAPRVTGTAALKPPPVRYMAK